MALAAALALAAGTSGEPVRFNRDIRPILSQNCFLCHGQDENRRSAGLRLDLQESAIAELESGTHAIVPGIATESELVARITSDDESLRMPPIDSHKELGPEEIELLQRWIAEGAEYEPHWAFVRPTRPKLPEVASAGNPIDAFVRERLRLEELQPAPEADRRTLIRRLSLDLTGLPPTPAEIREFLNDERTDAYERVVDRLLASPHFGERLALEWMDAARYADTHGYHIDSHRDMWPWRDWAIQAFNENMPFDQFTIWQLAGDLLPRATREQQVASGFNRNHPVNYEGGAIPEEYHVEYVIDRVSTTGTVWMGLTLGCARCHDHKYDPISQKEFFELFAFFNTVDEQGLDGHRGNAQPTMEVPTAEQSEARDRLESEIAALNKELADLEPRLVSRQHAWEADWESRPHPVQVSDWHRLGPISFPTPEEAIATPLDAEFPVDFEAKVTYHGGGHAWQHAPQLVDGKANDISGGDAAGTYLIRTLTASAPRTVKVHLGATDAIEAWLNGKPLWKRDGSRALDPHEQTLELPLEAGANQLLVKLVGYAWEWQFIFAFDPVSGVAPPPSVQEILKVAEDQRTKEHNAVLQTFFRANVEEELAYRTAVFDLASRQAELATLNNEVVTTMVMREQSQPRKTHLFERGHYSSPGEEVTPATPAALPPLPAGAPANRLTLAQWLVAPEHPLTARVTVNRLWQMFFGMGLVKTSEDFGLQGQWPSHPELLDWLAVEFLESGWDVKHLLRQMVMSETYRQSAAASPELIERDRENVLLARGPRFRLPAELLRDSALATSGLLDTRIGGPSVNPYQPGDLWGELAHQKHNYRFSAQLFVQDHGNDLYRRGMYTFWKRSVPPSNMVALDAPSRETCIVRRERTNTPLQALVLLNDPTFVEAARFLAQRVMLGTDDDPPQRVRTLFELATAREPNDNEMRILMAEYEQQLAAFRADPAAADALLSVGEAPRDSTLDAAAHAAWTNVALVILNLDETVNKG
ncbi:MAG: PSD1 and planctomycete cytochrome C domain-containing protein [Pirellulales bacterium]